MGIHKLHHDGLSMSEITQLMNVDRKTVRKYLEQRRGSMSASRKAGMSIPGWRICGWVQGAHIVSRLFTEVRKRGHDGCFTQAN